MVSQCLLIKRIGNKINEVFILEQVDENGINGTFIGK